MSILDELWQEDEYYDDDADASLDEDACDPVSCPTCDLPYCEYCSCCHSCESVSMAEHVQTCISGRVVAPWEKVSEGL